MARGFTGVGKKSTLRLHPSLLHAGLCAHFRGWGHVIIADRMWRMGHEFRTNETHVAALPIQSMDSSEIIRKRAGALHIPNRIFVAAGYNATPNVNGQTSKTTNQAAVAQKSSRCLSVSGVFLVVVEQSKHFAIDWENPMD